MFAYYAWILLSTNVPSSSVRKRDIEIFHVIQSIDVCGIELKSTGYVVETQCISIECEWGIATVFGMHLNHTSRNLNDHSVLMFAYFACAACVNVCAMPINFELFVSWHIHDTWFSSSYSSVSIRWNASLKCTNSFYGTQRNSQIQI